MHIGSLVVCTLHATSVGVFRFNVILEKTRWLAKPVANCLADIGDVISYLYSKMYSAMPKTNTHPYIVRFVDIRNKRVNGLTRRESTGYSKLNTLRLMYWWILDMKLLPSQLAGNLSQMHLTRP